MSRHQSIDEPNINQNDKPFQQEQEMIDNAKETRPVTQAALLRNDSNLERVVKQGSPMRAKDGTGQIVGI